MVWRSEQTYSEDLSARVLAAVDGGGRVHETAAPFEVSVSCIDKALAPRRLTGIATALAKSGRAGRKRDRHRDVLIAQAAENPDVTLAELVEWSKAERGAGVYIAAMWATQAARGISLKRRSDTTSSSTARILRLPRGHQNMATINYRTHRH